MADVDRTDEGPQEDQPMLGPYRPLLDVPGARAFSVAGLIGRLPVPMTGLGAVLLVAAETGRYGLAGAIAGTLSLSFAVVSPTIARLVDRRGQARVLRPAVAVFVAAGLGLVLAVELGAPTWTWFVLAALTGASSPNIGSMVRARWASAIPDQELRGTAFAFESVVDEVVFVTGPPLVTVLATAIAPPVGLLTALATGLVGSLMLSGLSGSEPVPEPRAHGASAIGVLRQPAVIVVALTYIGVGTVFGATDVVVVAFTEEQGRLPLAGAILAVYAAGSLVAGLVYGALRWKVGLAGRFVVTGLAFGVAGLGFLLVNSLALLAILAFLAGVTIAPVLVAGMSLVESRVPRSSLTEGLAWVTAGLTLGVTLGASVAGASVDAMGAQASFRVQTVGAGSAAVIALLGYLVLRAAGRRGAAPSD